MSASFAFEMLARDEAGFYDRLTCFTGLQRSGVPLSTVANKSPTNWQYIETLRRVNFLLRFVASAERPVRRLRQGNRVDDGAHRIIVYRSIVDRLSGFCGQSAFEGRLFSPEQEAMLAYSNRVTSELTGLAVKDYGYL